MSIVTARQLTVALFVPILACGDSSVTDGPSDSGAGDSVAVTPDSAGPSSDGGPATGDGSVPDGAAPGGGLHVVRGGGGVNGKLVDGNGASVQLRGVDRAGTEYSCLYGNFADGPVDQKSIDAIVSWKANAVRVPLNEDCWLGINGVPAAFSGKTYQAAVRAYVDLLEKNGLYVILDLHWAAPGAVLANGQLGMADADHAPTFWSQVAAAYSADNAKVLFDLFNEPFITDWACWLKGGTCATDYAKKTYTVAGMASLLKAVRGAGADNVVLMGGLAYSSEFSQWVQQVESLPTLAAPLDGLTTKNIALSWHAYSTQSVQTLCPSQYNGYSQGLKCATGAVTAMNYGVGPALTAGYPLVMGEVGIDTDSANLGGFSPAQAQQLDGWLESTLTWMDGQGQSYLAWNWNVQAPPRLLTAFDGTPTPNFGVTYKAHIVAK